MGPRALVLPPKSLSPEVSVDLLEREPAAALDEYGDLGRPIYASEWEQRNKTLCEFFGVGDVRELERKKRDVTVRRDEDGSIHLFQKGREIEVGTMGLEQRIIGQAIIEAVMRKRGRVGRK